MKTNLPMKKDESFIGKIKTFFKKLFGKPEVKIQDEIVENISNDKDAVRNIDAVETDNLKESNFIVQKESNTFQGIEEKDITEGIQTKIKGSPQEIENAKDELMRTLEANPGMLYDFPIEKLEMIEQYYNEKIAQCKRKLEKLKKN